MFYGMMGYNSDGTFRTGPAEPTDVFGRTAAQVKAEKEELQRMLDADRAKRQAKETQK